MMSYQLHFLEGTTQQYSSEHMTEVCLKGQVWCWRRRWRLFIQKPQTRPQPLALSCIDGPLFHFSESIAAHPVVAFLSFHNGFINSPTGLNKPRLMRPSVDVQEVMVAADRSFAVTSQHRVNYDSSPINSMGIKWAFPPQGCCAPQVRE